ncbi:hypothetical protein IQ07DRAFT_575371 [Pyrenochaeta sp. DS3sAY3a]|nr:hypothetical protein IQ07DRAFT_575371 [Pyrenochaeta sp. DS3sAY3a]
MSTPARQRVRTAEQLARKRHADRLNHRVRREKDKNQSSQLIVDVDSLRSELGALRTELQALKSATNAFPTTIPHITTWRPFSPLLSRCVESVEVDQDAAGPPRTELLQILADNYSPAAISDAAQSVAPTSRWPLLVFCVCGIEHHSKSECMEYISYRILLKWQVAALHQTPVVTCPPCTPSLPHLLLQGTDDNPIAAIMAPVFQCLKTSSVPLLFGIYILMYRLLRWRLYMDPQSYQDVPPWYRPSALQDTVPHIISIDYLPWPRLRDYMVSNNLLIAGSAHSVLMYTQAVRFSWPDSKELIIKSCGGAMVLNPNFESYVVSLENWKISCSWADRYPELAHLVNVEGATEN